MSRTGTGWARSLVFSGTRSVPPAGASTDSESLEVEALIPHDAVREVHLMLETRNVNFKNNRVKINGTQVAYLQGPGHGKEGTGYQEDLPVPEGVVAAGLNRVEIAPGEDVSGAGIGARFDAFEVADLRLEYRVDPGPGGLPLWPGLVLGLMVAALVARRSRNANRPDRLVSATPGRTAGGVALVLAALLGGTRVSAEVPVTGPDGVWQAPEAVSGGRWIRILHQNDLHGYGFPRRYAGEALPQEHLGEVLGGPFSVAAYLSAVRAGLWSRDPRGLRDYVRGGDDGVLLLDAGDWYGGTLFDADTRGEAMGRLLADPALDLDVTTLGNHAWDYGREGLERFLDRLSGKNVVVANLLVDGARPRGIPGWVRVEVQGARIGVVGLLTPRALAQALPEKTGGLEVTDPVAELDACLAGLSSGVDAVVVIAHFGLDRDVELRNRLDAMLAARPGHRVVLVVDGHSHRDVTERLASGPLLVQADHYGMRLGEVLLEIGPDRVPTGRVHARRILLRSRDWPPPIRMLTRFAEDLAARERLEEKVVAATRDGFAWPALARSDPRLVSPCGDLVARAFLEHMKRLDPGVQIGVMNQGGVRTGLYAGGKAVTRSAVHEILPFANTMAVMEVSGEALLALIEKGIQHVSRMSFAGLELEVAETGRDEAGFPTRTVRSLRVSDGKGGLGPLIPTARYRVATSQYLAGHGFSAFPDTQRRDYPETDSGVLATILAELAGRLGPLDEGRLAAWLGTPIRIVGR